MNKSGLTQYKPRTTPGINLELNQNQTRIKFRTKPDTTPDLNMTQTGLNLD